VVAFSPRSVTEVKAVEDFKGTTLQAIRLSIEDLEDLKLAFSDCRL